jgi:hypothetical protein
MQNQNPIDITLCRRIAYEEWKNFKKSQEMAIGAPDYLRYQDMRKLKHGRTNSSLHTPKITQTKVKG